MSHECACQGGSAYYFLGVYPWFGGLYAQNAYRSGFVIWKREFYTEFFGKKRIIFFIFLKIDVIDVMA